MNKLKFKNRKPAAQLTGLVLIAIATFVAVCSFQGCAQLPYGATPLPGSNAARGLDAQPGAMPSREEELWIIARADEASRNQESDIPGSGALMTKLSAE